ncbi:MAG: histidinol-phosphate transaminase [Clostridia bacterium]|nr:histidinol-phosphate transaminase [Clostridia bacterium]
MSRFLNEEYVALEAYTPGEQPRDKRYIKLNTNESPFPPSDGVLDALNVREVADLRLYPDPTCKVLREKLAAVFGCGAENVFVSNGSDDILNFAFMAFFSDGVLFPDVSYGFYKVYAELHGVLHETVPLREDFSIAVDDYVGKNKNVVIANPNAPTGLCLSRGEVERIVASNPDRVVLVDEAYVDFGGESAIPLVQKYDNLLVVRTFSKSGSLAGGRLGVAVGSAALISDLEKIKYSTNPYAINRLTLLAGERTVDDREYYAQNCRIIAGNRDYTASALRRLGFFVTESKANFVFAESPDIDGETLYKALRDRGILVRFFGKGRIRNFNRISIGTRADMDAFVEAVGEILAEHKKQREES